MRRQRFFWNTSTLIRRSLNACLMCLMVRQAGFTTLGEFERNFAEDGSWVGTEDKPRYLETLLDRLVGLLTFNGVDQLKSEIVAEERDVVFRICCFLFASEYSSSGCMRP